VSIPQERLTGPVHHLWAWDLAVGIRRELRKEEVEEVEDHPDSPVQILNLVD